MSHFDDLPDVETIKHQRATASATLQAKLALRDKELEPLFREIATKLRDLEPSSSFSVEKQVREQYGLFGMRTRERMTSVRYRGWDLGCVSDSGNYPMFAYLLADGTVYPNIQAGVLALLGNERRYYSDSLDNSALASKMRSLLIERLKEKYNIWCLIHSTYSSVP